MSADALRSVWLWAVVIVGIALLFQLYFGLRYLDRSRGFGANLIQS
jgi:hypothetical protein